jgi:hypothetical protein
MATGAGFRRTAAPDPRKRPSLLASKTTPIAPESRRTTSGSSLSSHELEHTGGYAPDEARQVAATMLPDLMHYNPASFPSNGRALTDDAADVFVAIVTNGKVKEDKVGPHRNLLPEFPYLGPPHKARVLSIPAIRDRVVQGALDADAMRLLKIMLKAGGKQGVPQGGVISPLLGNIYLTEVDRMLERRRRLRVTASTPTSNMRDSRTTW